MHLSEELESAAFGARGKCAGYRPRRGSDMGCRHACVCGMGAKGDVRWSACMGHVYIERASALWTTGLASRRCHHHPATGAQHLCSKIPSDKCWRSGRNVPFRQL